VEDKPPLSDAQRADWLATFRTPAQQAQTPVTREIAPIVVQAPDVDARTCSATTTPRRL